LLVFVDESDSVYGLIAIREGSLKDIVKKLSWVKHFKDMGKKSKRKYLRAFPRRFLKVKQMLVFSKIFFQVEELIRFLNSIKRDVEIIVLDDRLYGKIRNRINLVNYILESRKPFSYRRLMLLADNLANYGRIQLSKYGWKKALKYIKELEK